MRTRRHSPLATRSRRRTNIIPRLDILEDRRLMAVAFVETALPVAPGHTYAPSHVARAADGAVWTIGLDLSSGNATPSTYRATRTDSAGVTTNVSGLPDGETPVALFAADNSSVWTVTAAASGGGGHVVKLNADFYSTGVLTDETPRSAALGGDGNVWITATASSGTSNSVVERFDPRTGVFTRFASPSGSAPVGPIVAASDGNLWFVEPIAGKVAKVNTLGQITEYAAGITPWTIAAGAAGTTWIAGTDPAGHAVIAKVAADGTTTIATTIATTAGQSTPFTDSHMSANTLAGAADGSLWFINATHGSIGHLKADGSLDDYPLPTMGTRPGSLTGDGGLGFNFIQSTIPGFANLRTDAPDPGVSLTAKSIEHAAGPLPSGLTIASFTTTDAAAFPFDFIARYQIANQAPQVGTVLSDGRGGFVVRTSGTDPVQRPGSAFLSVTVLDVKHNNSIGAKSSGIGLVKINAGAVTIAGLNLSATAGVAYTGTIATLTDPDGGVAGDSITQATIDWGDGGTSSTAVTPSSSSATNLAFPVGHVYANAGNFTITITANHGGTISTGTSSVSVKIPSVTAIAASTAGYSQGHRSEALVATFETATESVAANYRGRSDLPGYPSTTRIVQVGSTSFEVWETIEFASWGETQLPLSVTTTDGFQSNVQSIAIVTPAPITASTLPIRVGADSGGVYGFARGPIASFSSGNRHAAASDFRATITSSDGGSWRAWVVADGRGGFVVEGDHKFPTAAAAGTFVLTIKIDNYQEPGQLANAATLGATASVAAYVPGLGVVEGVSATAPVGEGWIGYIGSFIPSDPGAKASDFSVSVHWDDGTPDSPGTSSPLGDGSFLIGVGHVFPIVGHRTATIDIVSSTGGHATATATFHVLPPPFAAIGSALIGTQGTAISGVVATFHDATPSAPSAYSATIDWGDGTLSTGAVSTYQEAFVVYGSHVYATAGPHTYSVVMKENDGTPVTATGTITVAVTNPTPKPVGTPAGSGPVGGGPMRIVSARSIRSRRGLIRVVITLSGTVDAKAVSDASQYVLIEPGKLGKPGTKDKVAKITGATYDSSTKTLTLAPKGTFRRPVAFRVGIVGSASVTALAS